MKRFRWPQKARSGLSRCWAAMLARTWARHFERSFVEAGVEAVAKAVSELPVQPADRIRATVPDLRRLRLVGEHADGRPQTLSDRDREHFKTATKNGGLTGDKLGMQTPVVTRGDSQKKTRTVHKVRENASFSEVVGILEDARVAEEGLEVTVDFQGKTYNLAFAGDSRGIIRPEQP